jgi:hypothetical protein
MLSGKFTKISVILKEGIYSDIYKKSDMEHPHRCKI